MQLYTQSEVYVKLSNEVVNNFWQCFGETFLPSGSQKLRVDNGMQMRLTTMTTL